MITSQFKKRWTAERTNLHRDAPGKLRALNAGASRAFNARSGGGARASARRSQ